MKWKFSSRFPSVPAEDIDPEVMNEVCKDELKSTYHSDYTGIPQGKAKPIVLISSMASCRQLCLFLEMM